MDCKTPGQLIRALLEEYGWTQRVLAIVLDVEETGINKIVSGKRPVTAEMAVLLGELFDTPAERFLDLQKLCDLAKARFSTRPDPGRTNRAHLFGGLPVTEMIKRRWIEAEDIKDVSAVESSLARFFGGFYAAGNRDSSARCQENRCFMSGHPQPIGMDLPGEANSQ